MYPITINEKMFCPYCGKEILRSHYHNNMVEDSCDCDDWRKAEKITEIIEELKSNMPKRKYELRGHNILTEIKI